MYRSRRSKYAFRCVLFGRVSRYQPTNSTSRNRSGVEILELILVLPILFLTLAGGLQFSSVISVDTTLCHAALEAARLASFGCDEVSITERVDEFLGIHNMALGGGSRVVIEDSSGIVESIGDNSLTSPTIGSAVPVDCVRATLIVETDSAPVPNALANYCVDFSSRQFEHSAIAIRQTCNCP